MKILTILEVLFICKNENDCISHFTIVNDPMEFLPSFVNPISVCTVHDKYQPLCASVIVSPQWADLILPTNILQKWFIFQLLSLGIVIGIQIASKKESNLTQTLNLTFLYVTVSTLNPTVGIVVTDCPNFSLYNIAVKKEYNENIKLVIRYDMKFLISLVFPAASRPSMSILISLFPNIFDSIFPIFLTSTPTAVIKQKLNY